MSHQCKKEGCPVCDPPHPSELAALREQNKQLLANGLENWISACEQRDAFERDNKRLETALAAAQNSLNAFYLGSPENRLLAMTKERDALRERLAEAEKMIAGKDDHFMNAHLRAHMVVLCDENDALRERLATSYAESHLTRAIDFIKKAGHLPGCEAIKSSVCRCCKGRGKYLYDTWSGEAWVPCPDCAGGKLPPQPGKCGCGHDEIVEAHEL